MSDPVGSFLELTDSSPFCPLPLLLWHSQLKLLAKTVLSSFCGYPTLSVSCQDTGGSSDCPLEIALLQIPRERKWIGTSWHASSCQFRCQSCVGGSEKRDTVQRLTQTPDRDSMQAHPKMQNKRKRMTLYMFSHSLITITCIDELHLLPDTCQASCSPRWFHGHLKLLWNSLFLLA